MNTDRIADEIAQLDRLNPGFYGDAWIIRIPGGPGFAHEAINALRLSAAARIPGPTSDTFYRLAAALEEANAA